MHRWKKTVAVAVLVGLLIAVAIVVVPRPPSGLQTFQSYEDLARYLDEVRARGLSPFSGNAREAFGGTLPPGAGATVPGDGSFSGTNVQVQGVDEMDTVKSDGTYLYLASPSNVTIVRAYPADEMAIVSRINVTDALEKNTTSRTVTGVFVAGERLVVVASDWYGYRDGFGGPEAPIWDPGSAKSSVQVFDLTAIDKPSLAFSVAVSGSPVNARMANGVVYLTTLQYISSVEGRYLLPQVCSADNCGSIDVQRVYYEPEAEDANTFTNVLAVEIDAADSRTISLITGYTSTLYMSTQALYASYIKWEVRTFAWASETSERTSIYKIRVQGIDLEPVAEGQVPGRLLNQFSMDEHDGHLRVATTSGQRTRDGGTTTNSVFVLNGTLAVVGRLEGLAPGETIYSARFIGDRAYLVTFEKIDPFFVIDLSNPGAPRLLGSLKIPGYSDYLHPLDEDRIIGLGKEAVPTEDNFSWFQGLKLSMFDVADAEHPEELSKIILGDRGTDSEALYDHKAFLLSPTQGLLVLPVALYEFAYEGSDRPPFEYGQFVHQGAYVFSVTLERGFEVRGVVIHDDPSAADSGYGDPSRWVRRSLWIEDTLYTISPALVKANLLSDLSEVGSVVYGPGEGFGEPRPPIA